MRFPEVASPENELWPWRKNTGGYRSDVQQITVGSPDDSRDGVGWPKVSCRGCVILFVFMLLVVAGLAGGAYYLVTQPSLVVAHVPTVTPTSADATTFDQKLSRFLKDVGSNSPFDDSTSVLLEITEAEATSKLADLLASGLLPVDISNPQVHFWNDRCQVSLDVDLNGVKISAAVELQISVQDGKPRIAIDRLELGQVDIPESLRQPVLDAIAAGIDSTNIEGLPFAIGSIRMSEGVLTIEGIKPAR